MKKIVGKSDVDIDDPLLNEVYDYLMDNYEDYERLELIEENEPSVASYNQAESCVVFHKTL